MKQSIEERRLHHQTREDRQRNAYEYLKRRIFLAKNEWNKTADELARLNAYERDFARLGEKLGIV